jgi:hypothetical protein
MKFFEMTILSKGKLLMLFVLKLLAAAAVWLLYTHYYNGSDFFTYFSDSSALVNNIFSSADRPYSSAWNGNFDDSFFSSSRVMIVLNAFLHLFSFGNFYVHVLFFCFFSFIGLSALLKAFASHSPSKKNVIIALFSIPSVLFWGSAALKESLIIGSVGLLVYLTDFGLKRTFRKKDILICILMILLLLFLKFYVLIVLLPLLVVNVIVAGTSSENILFKYFAVYVSLVLFALLLSFASDDLNVLKVLSDKRAKAISEAKGGKFLASKENFVGVEYDKGDEILIRVSDGAYRIKDGSSYLLWKQNNMSDTTFIIGSKDTSEYTLLYEVKPANSVISMKKLEPGIKEYLINAPSAFVNTLCRPFFTDINSFLHLFVAVENAWIIFLIILSICFFDKNILEKKEILLFCLVFSVSLFLLIGFTTPAIGAMVRYRTIGLIFLTSACFLMLDEEKLKRKLFRRPG